MAENLTSSAMGAAPGERHGFKIIILICGVKLNENIFYL
ncbi:hypothetical protein L861_07595 [Litchfieldella anticariensis FP35 = DSM 16096]|uniref:Uncharacterized protein n=1 Tax=Litchfieldella anticariensis (strain DSM 16096 / CECT 5854 / CIP 108499 / LMG 22089 / FP35) TaxID=1121939 RepID=S2KX62_LITA3|nr:hypothetical protein L861_07595 [Halomonas anticariensis FP35 = DSM 16096]